MLLYASSNNLIFLEFDLPRILGIICLNAKYDFTLKYPLLGFLHVIKRYCLMLSEKYLTGWWIKNTLFIVKVS